MRLNLSLSNRPRISEILPTSRASAKSLTEEYKFQQALISVQPAIIKQHLELQGKQIAESIVAGRSGVGFMLPDQINCIDEILDRPTLVTLPRNRRAYSVGNLLTRIRRIDLHKQLHASLNGLENSQDQAISSATRLLRYAIVRHIIDNMLPTGGTGTYRVSDEDEMASSIPENHAIGLETETFPITVAKAGGSIAEDGYKGQQVSFDQYARKFYLPQWVVFDEDCDLLAKSVEEAESRIKSMQRFMELVFLTEALAPYISADQEYIEKRSGMLAQLLNQGRALAIYQTREIVSLIKELSAAEKLNRGLSLDLPYFDDQRLRMETMKIEIIPAGWVMFVPAFVVLAMCRTAIKVSKNTHINLSTREHLLNLLDRIRQAFETY